MSSCCGCECNHLPEGFRCSEEDLIEDMHVERDESGAIYRVTETHVFHHGKANVDVRVSMSPPEVDQDNKGGARDCKPLKFHRVRVKVLRKAPQNTTLKAYVAT